MDFDLFEEEMEKDRRARVEAARRSNEAFAQAEADAAVKRAESVRLRALETNERHRLAEYRFHGVEPPVIDGVPTKSSFHLLMSLGWTVEENLGKRWMVAPPVIAARQHRGREFYDKNT